MRIPRNSTHAHDPVSIRARLSHRSRVEYLHDFVYGALDGTVTTFAIISGVAGAGLPTRVIVTLGIANVLADGFSMAAGNYTATKADYQRSQKARSTERAHIKEFKQGEIDELTLILEDYGLESNELEDTTRVISRHERLWIDLMLLAEYGISPLLREPRSAAVATFVAFILCGSIPIVPFLLDLPDPFIVSMFLTGLTFTAIGIGKSHWTGVSYWRAAMETLAIGGAAAGIAYMAGKIVDSAI